MPEGLGSEDLKCFVRALGFRKLEGSCSLRSAHARVGGLLNV